MRQLELLAPARDKHIGIAAIDCGADAVYIAGPQFGARQAAGNSIEDIRDLCIYAHRFGARIFITLNTILYEEELNDAYEFMLAVQDAGADAIIVQDLAVIEMVQRNRGNSEREIKLPLHASTQCAIRTPEQAKYLESLGFSRLILERELSLEQIHKIRKAVKCELEFFVHGALCVCYSGQCYLSEMISGRSANRGACIQACRSRYDLVDSTGKVLVRDKALLSLKDYNLRGRLRELAQAGISSFKIEGRLKNESYVRNVVRDYSISLDNLIAKYPEEYERGAFGTIIKGFVPDTSKTFNRGYTELFLDGKRGKWAAMDAAKSMGEHVGTILSVGKGIIEVRLQKGVVLNNGDGFSFVARNGNIEGFRGDVCSGNTIRCRIPAQLSTGVQLYRNISTAFEKEIERQACIREILVKTDISFQKTDGHWTLLATATSEDGRAVNISSEAGNDRADNAERMNKMIESQIQKSVGHYRFYLRSINAPEGLPFMSASSLNGIRRSLADLLDEMPCSKKKILNRTFGKYPETPFVASQVTYKQNVANTLSRHIYSSSEPDSIEEAYELSHKKGAELMRSKYCIRHELGLCPVHQGAKATGPLFLLNNGRRLALNFDCKNCEMTVTEA